MEALRDAKVDAGGSGSDTDEQVAETRNQLAATLDQAYARRDKLRNQLAMADEFIGPLTDQLG